MVDNVCCKCESLIRVRAPKDFWLRKILKETDVAICKTCDPNSSWRRI